MKLRCLYPDVFWHGELLGVGDIIEVESEEDQAEYDRLAVFGLFSRIPDHRPPEPPKPPPEAGEDSKTEPMTSHASPTTVGRRVRR